MRHVWVHKGNSPSCLVVKSKNWVQLSGDLVNEWVRVCQDSS